MRIFTNTNSVHVEVHCVTTIADRGKATIEKEYNIRKHEFANYSHLVFTERLINLCNYS